MSAFLVAGETQANGTNHVRHHIIGVFFMYLNIGTKFHMNVLLVIKMFPS